MIRTYQPKSASVPSDTASARECPPPTAARVAAAAPGRKELSA